MTESSENYLETILILSQNQPVVRAVNLAKHLDVKPSSVSVAVHQLQEAGYILISEEGFLSLTDEGREIAEKIYERHKNISQWLESIGVPTDIAVKDACRIEHVISAESFEAIKKFICKN